MSLPETAETLLEPDLMMALSPPAVPAAAAAGPAVVAPSEWTVETVTSIPELESLGPEWNELLAASASDRLFLTWEWLSTFWKHLGVGGGRELAVAVVRRDGRLSLIAPLFRGPSPRGVLPGRSLQLLGTGTVGSDYLDLIVRAGEERPAVAALADHLAREGRLVELGQLTGSGTAAGILSRTLEARGWRTLERVVNVCPYIDLAGHSWESYVASLGRSHRANVRRRLRKLHQDFDVRFERVEHEDELPEALGVLLDLHHDRWKDRGGSDAFGDPSVEAFHRDVTRRALRRGWLRLFVLRLDGRPAAALYGFRYRDRFLFYQSGFDGELAGYSVGLVTMGLAIKSAIEEGIREYDLLHGDEAYKFLWASRSRELARLELFPPSLEARLRRQLRRTARGVKGRARRWLDGESAPRRWVARIVEGAQR